MGRSVKRTRTARSVFQPEPRHRGRPPNSRSLMLRVSTDSSVNYMTSSNGQQRFHLENGSTYTISTAKSLPEHHWGTIYAAEWSHPESSKQCPCVIKATEFLFRRPRRGEREGYKRPRNDFEREVRAFRMMRNRNILRMYDFWEWQGRGYIAMKQMKGSLGDIVYEPAHREILNELRCDEGVLAELIRQVLSRHNLANCRSYQDWNSCIR